MREGSALERARKLAADCGLDARFVCADIDYAVPDAKIDTPSYEWTHTLGEIVTALATAGLRIAFLHEHPFADWQLGGGMARGPDGYYRYTDPDAAALPLMYSIKATL